MLDPSQLTVEQVAECVELINSTEDLNLAAEQELRLYLAVLRAIANGAPDADQLAATALMADISESWVDQ